MPADAIFWLLIIFVVIILFFFGVTFLRRHFGSADESAGKEAFSLGGLRSMLKNGQITQEEYDRLRDHTVAAVKPASFKRRKPPGLNDPPPELK